MIYIWTPLIYAYIYKCIHNINILNINIFISSINVLMYKY